MNSLRWRIGKVQITQLTEVEAGSTIQRMIPSATSDKIREISWLSPQFADEQGNLKAVVQSFIIETPDRRIVVDTGVGNAKTHPDVPAWHNLQTQFLHNFESQGFSVDSIDIVLCTHPHFDHVGWNTHLVNGKWAPTFPKARYLFVEYECNYWKSQPEVEIAEHHSGFSDSVLPILDAGLADLIAENYAVCEEVSLLPTPGHTPGHVSILISSQGQQAVITGDAIHHPCQIAQPHWETLADTDEDLARRSRRSLLARFADTPTLLIGSHFAAPTAGYVRRDGASFLLAISSDQSLARTSPQPSCRAAHVAID